MGPVGTMLLGDVNLLAAISASETAAGTALGLLSLPLRQVGLHVQLLRRHGPLLVVRLLRWLLRPLGREAWPDRLTLRLRGVSAKPPARRLLAVGNGLPLLLLAAALPTALAATTAPSTLQPAGLPG